jgi:hypothetical protein
MGGNSEMQTFGGKIRKKGTIRRPQVSTGGKYEIEYWRKNSELTGLIESPSVYGPMKKFREYKERFVTMRSVSNIKYLRIQY